MAKPDWLLEDEFAEPYQKWQARPSPVTADTLIKAVSPVLDSAMRTYGGSVPSPTLRSKAKLMALDAVQKYDPSRAKLRTHLMSHLQGLRRASAQEQQIIKMPERVALDALRIRAAENLLRDRVGRDPSDLELADESGLSLRRLEHIRQARPGSSEGSFIREGEEGMQAFDPGVVNTNDKVWLNFVYHDMQPSDQIIMEHTLGLHGKPRLSKQQIARKLGISPGAVSQRAAKIQDRINVKDDLGMSFF